YNWSTGATTANITDLAGGDYSVTVTDANGCSRLMAFTVLASNAIDANISTSGCNDGSLNLAVSGGMPPYTYLWSNGASDKDIKVTEAGTYGVTVTDANGCIAVTDITITNPQTFDLAVSDTKPTCSGGNDGSIDLTVTGGQAPYSYLWSNGSTDEDLTNIASGSYTVTVTDDRGCSQILTYFLSNPTSIFISGTATPIQCGGNNADGEIDLKIFNGVAPYTFSWSTGETTEDISGLVAGFYTVTVTDATGCSNMRTFEIEEPNPIQLDLTQLYCGDGYLCPTIAGGSGSFSYEWSTGEFTSCIQVTEAGTYTLTVRDENNCETTKTITIGEPSPKLDVDVTWTGLTCNAANDGTADLTIIGGKEPYDIVWSHGATSQSVSGLSAGVYQVAVTDANGCSQSKLFNLTAPEAISIVAQTITQSSCTDQSDGAIDISVTSGTGPFTYAWSTGATTEDISGLMVGFYDVTVTDVNGCSHSSQFEVTPVNATDCGGGDPGDGGDGGDGSGDPGDGNPDDGSTDGPCVRDCNECDGQVTELTLKYLGSETGANITVTQMNDGQVAFDGTVSPEGTFSLAGQDQNKTLTTEIIIVVNGVQNTTIHTGCEMPIGPGMINGDFEIVDGESRNGGLLCPVAPDEQPQDEEPPVVDPGTEECPDAFSTAWSISNEENGCTTYTMEVMYNGQGRHGLSHFSIDIPCGDVTEASNSEGWPMELNGKDPTTGLVGFKVDDINGFGEGSTEQSFEVSFTLCTDGATCKDNLADWAPMVAYKAGQCVNYDTLSHTARTESSNTRTFVDYDLYPNPSKQGNEVKLRFNEINDQEEVVVAIRNLTGVSFYNEQHKIDGSKEVLLQLNRLPEGVYFVTVKAHEKLYTSKLIVQ
ncbi:MAG: T9SS type A sorting domain-containing protein, partial [Cyclobacteriaceae bacterium]